MLLDEYNLKDCPFCGSEDLEILYREFNSDGELVFCVSCYECGVEGPAYYGEPKADDPDTFYSGAAELWNDRKGYEEKNPRTEAEARTDC